MRVMESNVPPSIKTDPVDVMRCIRLANARLLTDTECRFKDPPSFLIRSAHIEADWAFSTTNEVSVTIVSVRVALDLIRNAESSKMCSATDVFVVYD